MKREPERRSRRSGDVATALRYQLEACRAEGRLDGILVADDDGLCVAHAGDEDACGEIAAHLPMLGRKTERFRGVLLRADGGTEVVLKRFNLGSSTLYACAIGRADDRSEVLVQRSIGGATRILGRA
jgi:hypothetical protein